MDPDTDCTLKMLCTQLEDLGFGNAGVALVDGLTGEVKMGSGFRRSSGELGLDGDKVRSRRSDWDAMVEVLRCTPSDVAGCRQAVIACDGSVGRSVPSAPYVWNIGMG